MSFFQMQWKSFELEEHLFIQPVHSHQKKMSEWSREFLLNIQISYYKISNSDSPISLGGSMG